MVAITQLLFPINLLDLLSMDATLIPWGYPTMQAFDLVIDKIIKPTL